MDRNHNLLFGVLAAQFNKATTSQLVNAAARWLEEPSKDLPVHLVEMSALAETDRLILENLTQEAVRLCSGDSYQAIDAFGGEARILRTFGAIGNSGRPESKSKKTESIDPADSVPGVQEAPGRYGLVAEHARGGMGRILLVHDAFLGRDIALKELLANPSSGDSTIDAYAGASPVRGSVPLITRFLQEARITSQLEHPCIVPVYEVGYRPDGTLYYTMKLVRGKTLAQAIQEAGSLQERLKLLPHFVDLCQAVAYAHSKGVIHRDIKPRNVMVGEFGETVLLDWGLAKFRDREDDRTKEFSEALQALSQGRVPGPESTVYGQAIGTPCYMPPEQAEGRFDIVDERSDVYSLGAVLYEILTGRPPYAGSASYEVLYKVLNELPKRIRSLEYRAPAGLVQICRRAMSRRREDRYPSAKEMAAQVQSYHARPFYLDPTRPTIYERVPQLTDLPRADQRKVLRQARGRMFRLVRFWVGNIISVALLLAIAFLCLIGPRFLLDFAEVVGDQQQVIDNLQTTLDTVAARSLSDDDHPTVNPIQDNSHLTPWVSWFEEYSLLVILLPWTVIVLFSYLWLKMGLEIENEIRANLVREVLAERAIKPAPLKQPESRG